MDAVELAVHRANTKAFIDADPVTMTLNRKQKVDQPDGGYKMQAGPLQAPQTFRLIPANDRMPEISSSTGRLVAPVYTLLGTWDCDMARWDTFELNGEVFEIASPIRPEHTSTSIYERKGDVVRREDG